MRIEVRSRKEAAALAKNFRESHTEAHDGKLYLVIVDARRPKTFLIDTGVNARAAPKPVLLDTGINERLAEKKYVKV